MIHDDPVALVSLLPPMRRFLKEELAVDLHQRKIILKKLGQGIDFLGYVVLHKHRLLRAKTRQRMVKRLTGYGVSREQMGSYLGLLLHCDGHAWEEWVRGLYEQSMDERWS